MTAGNGHVEMRWIPPLGSSCRGAVDLTTTGLHGTIERAVALPDALALGAVIDLLCPTSTRVNEHVVDLASSKPARPGWDR